MKSIISLLILTALTVFNASPFSQQRQTQEMELAEFNDAGENARLLQSLAATGPFFTPPLNVFESSQDLDQIILEEAAAIDQVSGFKTVVRLSDSDDSSSDPVRGIEISRKQMRLVRERSGVRRFREMVRFFLAHEKAHQFQYRMYSAAAVKDADAERRRLYECQADVLAGKYLVEMMGSPTESDLQIIQDTLQFLFDIGEREFSDSDHPSHEARRTAIRLGMASGTITSLSRFPPDPVNQSMIRSLAEKVDFLPGETVMDWSYRLSKKITHYSRATSADLSLEDKQVDWDTRASNPFVTFSLTYKNTGSRSLMVDMEVQCAAVPRDDDENTKYWLKWSVKNFRFKLSPGGRFTANGKLQWYGDRNLMPRLVYPPDPKALLSCEFSK